ncbi:MAG: NAD(+)/NADH kinase [Clostridiales bacterium]|jgi:NAD+ kinase|nr:NAD(+)/NADH kinase [Clostridiales bacterium]
MTRSKTTGEKFAVGVLPNADRDENYIYTREVCDFLQKRGYLPVLEPETAAAAGLSAFSPGGAVYEKTGFLTVLGGDGTMLAASHKAAPYGTPLFGINLGRLGYLTDADRHDGLAALEKVLNGDCRYERRMMLAIDGDAAFALKTDEKLALNDVCLSRGGFGKLITFELYVNGMYMDTLRADGVIVATPTGSTAYNLSAGGPILSPDGEFTVITPVCPHALYTRPWVINARDAVTLCLTGETSASVSLDGENRLTLESGARVSVCRAEYQTSVIKTSNVGFYEILRKKIGG